MKKYLILDIHVKFRAFGITFGQYTDKIDVTDQLPTLAKSFLDVSPEWSRTVVDQRGVWIKLRIAAYP